MKVVAFVPMKLQSERVPKKNLKLLGGKPLYLYILEALVKVSSIDEIYVYCSDKAIANKLPEPVRFLQRDEVLDKPETLGGDIYNSFIREIDADIYILAHTTSPFMRAETIGNALDQVINCGHDSAFPVQEVKNFIWFNGEPLNYSLDAVPRTQDLSPIYVETSGFFVFKKEVWCELGQRIGKNPFMCPVDYSEGVDIDEPEDFKLAELLVDGGD